MILEAIDILWRTLKDNHHRRDLVSGIWRKPGRQTKAKEQKSSGKSEYYIVFWQVWTSWTQSLDGQSRAEYVIMANECMQPIMAGLSQAIEDVGCFMVTADVGRPKFKLFVPELVAALRAAGVLAGGFTSTVKN